MHVAAAADSIVCDGQVEDQAVGPVKDPTTSPSGDLIPTIRGSGAHPGRGVVCFYYCSTYYKAVRGGGGSGVVMLLLQYLLQNCSRGGGGGGNNGISQSRCS
jgi:hypothetical protein